MLKNCTNGFEIVLADHFRRVLCNGKIYRTLPKYDAIERGHIRSMVRFLDINRECAQKWLGFKCSA